MGRLVAVVAVLGLGTVGVLVLTRATTPAGELSAADIPALQLKPAHVQPDTSVPAVLTAADPVSTAPTTLTDWAQKVSAATGIPEPAAWAYGNAELATRANDAGCQLTWATLAGIGRIESNNGQFGGASLRPNGEETKPIIGVPLDGTGGNADIPDTDHGALDGDPVHDRAVGPMQFLPQTWHEYGQDAMGTTTPDPENINDAALTAAKYLCADGRDLSTPVGWWAAIMSYNASIDYVQKVFGVADNYARTALKALGTA
ncbi:MAG TPA: murein transglycosylase [Pseudonocardiaceae bacterium]|nr:murein transglycosylase [Pseudonocardiaceae bacterium]